MEEDGTLEENEEGGTQEERQGIRKQEEQRDWIYEEKQEEWTLEEVEEDQQEENWKVERYLRSGKRFPTFAGHHQLWKYGRVGKLKSRCFRND